MTTDSKRSPRGLRALFLSLIALSGLGLGSVGCTSPETSLCESGLVCPPGTACAAKQDVCIRGSCGNGVVDAGEVCDDGNVKDGDKCSATCLSTEGCGNGILDPDEICDDGNNQGGDGCAANCLSNEACGNGEIDEDISEVCDDGNNRDGDGCSASCSSSEICGNAIIDAINNEVCDDGNRDNTDGCSNDCISTLDCGNDIQDVENGEECDDGNDDNTDGCIIHPELLCKKASCGDGFVFADKEECDGNGNGNGGETKSCNLNCTTSQCGDGFVNPTDDEQCDDGLENGNYNHCASNCTQTGAMCGDGTRNGPEVCDGQTVTGSDAVVVACNADCSGYPPYCGDGDDNAAAETCDDGAANGRYNGVCNNDCTGLPIRCGDTVTQGEHGEQCDLGDENSNNWHAAQDESCTTTCRRGLYCDDGSLTTASESCERGWELEWRFDSRDVKSTCHDDCSGYCGDGRLQNRSRIDNIVIEYCDPEDDAAPDNCRENCTYCGDGTRQQPAEECDSGAQNRDQPGFCRVDCSGVFPSPD